MLGDFTVKTQNGKGNLHLTKNRLGRTKYKYGMPHKIMIAFVTQVQRDF